MAAATLIESPFQRNEGRRQSDVALKWVASLRLAALYSARIATRNAGPGDLT
jgi:hypothetical protein